MSRNRAIGTGVLDKYGRGNPAPTVSLRVYGLVSKEIAIASNPPLRFHSVIRTFFLNNVQLNVAFYDSDLLIGQAVELIDHLINQFIGLLNTGEQGFEVSEAISKLTL